MKKYLPPSAVFLFMLGSWEFIVKYFHIDNFILPAPSKIASAIWSTAPLLWMHSLRTLTEAMVGFGLAVVSGLFLSVLMGMAYTMKRTLYPLVIVSQTIPIIAVAPLLVIWFGWEMMPKIIVVVLVCFFPITISLVEGFGSIDPDMVKLLMAMGGSRRQIFKKVQFPGAMPSFFAGLKIAATYSVMGAVIGEWLGASKGLGIYLTRSMHSFMTEQVFAAIVVISILSLFIFIFVEIGGRLLMPWHYQKGSWQEGKQ